MVISRIIINSNKNMSLAINVLLQINFNKRQWRKWYKRIVSKRTQNPKWWTMAVVFAGNKTIILNLCLFYQVKCDCCYSFDCLNLGAMCVVHPLSAEQKRRNGFKLPQASGYLIGLCLRATKFYFRQVSHITTWLNIW